MIVIGVMAKTGSAVAVALSGTAAAPLFRARREIELVPPGLDHDGHRADSGRRQRGGHRAQPGRRGLLRG